MSAALKSQEVLSTPSQPRSARPRLKVVSSQPLSTPMATPLHRDRPRQYPLWLKLLVLGQRLSLGVACISVMGALVAYGLTVNTNRRLTLATANLEHLQEQQRQLSTANAVFKNHLAQTALTSLQRSQLHPKDVIFLEAAALPAAPPAVAEPTPSTSSPLGEKRFFPQGY